MTLMIVLQV